MKAIREKSSGRILYTGPVQLTSAGVVGDGFADPMATPDFVEEIELYDVPVYFRPGACSYADGVWAIVDPRINVEQAQVVRADRDKRLADCDWRVIKAAETGVPMPAEWATYRQALRDVTAQAGFPWDIAWPEKPTA